MCISDSSHRVLVISHTIPESLTLRQNTRLRIDTFQGVRDVVEYIQVLDNRPDLVIPHVWPAGLEYEEVTRSHQCGIGVRQTIYLRKDLILPALCRLAERREETRWLVLGDSSADPGVFGLGALVAR